jgi:hypothetical protein
VCERERERKRERERERERKRERDSVREKRGKERKEVEQNKEKRKKEVGLNGSSSSIKRVSESSGPKIGNLEKQTNCTHRQIRVTGLPDGRRKLFRLIIFLVN